jgi:DNA polymerase I-like protein with 3'-5' exonuclease and polymerase domains
MPAMKDDEAALAAKVEEQLQEVAAVDKFTLNKICAEFKELQPLQEYRKAFKLYSTYVRPLRNLFSAGLDKKQRTADPHLCFDDCIHASFLLTGTRGGRLSCRDPNLQQLPRDGEVKQMFVSRFGKRGCMYQGDLSQIELRLMAAACGDPTMIEAYFKGTDLHSLTASRIYNVPYEHFTKGYMKELQDKGRDKEAKKLELNRVTAKTVNFLTGYGGGAFGLQNVLAMKNISMKIEECQHIIESFFDTYPALRDLLQQYKRFIIDSHVAVSIFGRVRIFEEVRGDDDEAKAKALRAGCNHLIQSTASDMMLTALFVIELMMRNAELESMLVSTVHDSLVIDCVREELPQVHDIVLRVLNNFPEVFKIVFGDDYDTSWMIVPFSGDCEVGLDYLNTRKIPDKDIDWDKLLSEDV